MLINIPKHIDTNSTIPAGIYKALVTSTTLKKSEKTQNDYTQVEFTIQSQGDDQNIKTIGRKCFDNWVWTPESLGVVEGKYKALTGGSLTEFAGDGVNCEQLHMQISNRILNRECLLQVTLEPVKRDGVIVEGEFRNNIKKIQALTS